MSRNGTARQVTVPLGLGSIPADQVLHLQAGLIFPASSTEYPLRLPQRSVCLGTLLRDPSYPVFPIGGGCKCAAHLFHSCLLS